MRGSHSDWKTREHFPVREKLGNFTKTGKVGEFYPKYWENQKELYWESEKTYWKSQRNLTDSENPVNMVPYLFIKEL